MMRSLKWWFSGHAAVSVVLVAAALLGFPAFGFAGTGGCVGVGRAWDFEGGSIGEGFDLLQRQRGEAGTVADPVNPSNRVARLMAGRKYGKKVGKADVVHRFPPLGKGAEIEMSARVFFPDGTPLDSLILMDLECASCGLDTNPGIRLYLRKGLLRVDRSKIGIKEPFYPETFNALGTGAWHEIAWHVTLGEGQKGRSIVYLDGAEVSDARGTTVLTQAVVSQLADIRVKEQADRFQVGITANSNPRAAVMLLDDVGFCVR